MDEERRWQAVVDCDSDADGQFFYGVKTVGVFCRPSCRSRTPLRQNTLYFENSESALVAGFRPCKRCRPDLLNYAPASEIATQAKLLIDGCFDRRTELAKQMRELGVSTGHLVRIFKSEYGLTPGEYRDRVRVARARDLLDSNAAIADVAWEVGFGSLSAFYRFFSQHTGTTPSVYRAMRQAREPDELEGTAP